jgi:hypothetical protein
MSNKIVSPGGTCQLRFNEKEVHLPSVIHPGIEACSTRKGKSWCRECDAKGASEG